MRACWLLALLLALPSPRARAQDRLPLERVQLPRGFHIAEYARVPNARGLALGARGTVFVGSMSAGRVHALIADAQGTHARSVKEIAANLRMPVGVAFHDGALYISAVDRIVRLDDIEAHLDDPPVPRTVTDALPRDAAHGWRFIAFGPDHKLYVPIGAPCNVCDKPGYAKLVRMEADGSGMQEIAFGVRNSVGFDWQPGTGTLWFTDNGRDWLGDDVPADELNRLGRTGEHFGFPFCHQGDIADPQFGKQRPCGGFTPPVLKLGAHVAALGMRFYDGRQFPGAYTGSIFIAEHGSWNRSQKVGYRIVNVRIEGNRAIGSEAFASGWLGADGKPWGRPVDVLVMPDGALLISDDLAGAVYRISYSRP